MRTRLTLLALCLLISIGALAQTVTLTGTKFKNIDKSLIKSGKFNFEPVNNRGEALNYRDGGGGQTSKLAKFCAIVNGAVVGTCTLPDTSMTTPVNSCVHGWVTDASGNELIGRRNVNASRPSGYDCIQTAQNNDWCTNGVCNFDNYVPAVQAGVVQVSGPTGPQGPIGLTGPQGQAALMGASRGSYSTGTTYAVGDVVAYSGQSYASLVANNVGNQPDTSPTKWGMLTSLNNLPDAFATQSKANPREGNFSSVAVGTTSLTQANATGVCQMASALGFALDDSDETAKLQALITKWADGGTGGCMAVDAGKTLGVYGQISIPETTTFAAPPPSPAVGITRLFLDASAPGACTGGGTAQAQCKWNGSAWVSAAPYALPSMRITGSAPAMTLSDIGGLPVGSSILDLRYAGNRLTSVAFTTLEIDHLLVKNNGTNCGAFFFSTLTSMRIHDNGFLGAKSGMNACDDVWIAGGTHNVNSMHGDDNDYFQGYGSYMVHNGADQIRRLLLAGAAFNGIPVKDNLVGRGSGSSLTLPITAATNAASAVLTTADEPRTYFAGHNLPIGRSVPLIFTGFTGNWTSLNGAHNATATDASHLTVAIDSSGFGPLTGTPAYYNGAAIEFSSGNDEPVLGGVQQGAQIDGNIIEQTGYAFCVKMLTGFRNKIKSTGCYDTTVNSSAFFWFGNATKGNITELSGPDLLANVWDASTNGGNPILTYENGYPILASVGNAGIGQVVQSINGTALAGIDSGATSGIGVIAENTATNTPALKATNKSTGNIAEFFSGVTQKVYIDKDGNLWIAGTVQVMGGNGVLFGSNAANKILTDNANVFVEADNRLYLGRSGKNYVQSDGWHVSNQFVQNGAASPQSAGQLGLGSTTANTASAGTGAGAMCATPNYLIFYLGSTPIKIPYCGN